MNDHPAHRGDIVRVHPGVKVDTNHDLSGMTLTVHAVYTGQHNAGIELRPGELALTEWTGCPPVIVLASDVDVLTPSGCAA